MGSAVAEGENRAHEAVSSALSSPLLNDNDIAGAKYVLLNITYGDKEILMDEIAEITDFIQDEAGSTADVIWGHGKDESLGEGICVTLIATGFQSSPITGFEKAPEKKKHVLEDKKPEPTEAPKTENTISTETVAETENPVVEEPYLKSADEVQAESTEETTEAKPEQVTLDWNFGATESTPANEDTDVVKYNLDDEDDEDHDTPANFTEPSKTVLSPEEQQAKLSERMDKIKDYTDKLKSSEGVDSLESEPAYLRKNVSLDDTPHSSENNISRFTLGENEDGENPGLKSNNSFLHDNVD
jgi:cell division protein FtsZ